MLTNFGEIQLVRHTNTQISTRMLQYCSYQSLTPLWAHCLDYWSSSTLYFEQGGTYNITNEVLIGACFLPAGCGNMGKQQQQLIKVFIPIETTKVGSVLTGRISDPIVVKWKKRRGGNWIPEDRLRATLFGGGVLVPLSIILCGVATEHLKGKVGLIFNLVCLFVNGAGVSGCFRMLWFICLISSLHNSWLQFSVSRLHTSSTPFIPAVRRPSPQIRERSFHSLTKIIKKH